jgi:DNA-binding CsgD family transcriptional regulator
MTATTPAAAVPPTPLTDRQHAILDAIHASRARRGIPPTVAEIAAVTGTPAGIVRVDLAELLVCGWLRPASGPDAPAPDRNTRPEATSGPVEPSTTPARPLLTPRQRQALQLVADGLTDAQIGETTHTSTNTIKTHLTRAYATLGATNRTHAVAIAIRCGVIQ